MLTRLQAELPALPTNSRHVTLPGATHYTLVSEPEHAEVVSEAIRVVSAAAHSGDRMGALWSYPANSPTAST